MNCIYCRSENIYFSKKRGVYVCEDCGKTFAPQERPFTPKKVFLSYGHDENAEIVERIYEKLKERGHIPWIDYAKIKTGHDWRERITQGILESDGFLAFLSRYSVRVPGVCLDEISIGVGNYNCRINSILLEKGITAPNSISNIQWLDLSDWREKKNGPDPAVYEAWLNEKVKILLDAIEDDRNTVLAGNIDRLQKRLTPITNFLKMRLLLQNQIIPRKWLLEEIRNVSGSPVTVVYGSPGTGKSVLSAYLCNFSSECAAAYFFEWNNSATKVVRNLICSLIFQLACSIEDYQVRIADLLDRYDIRSMSEDEITDRFLLGPLNTLIDSGRAQKLVILDAVDEAVLDDPRMFDSILRIIEGLPAWIRVLMTSRPEAVVTERLQQYRRVVIDAHVREMENDIREYVSLEIKETSSAEKIIRKCEGSFIYAREMIRLYAQGQLDSQRLPSGLSGAYYTYFRRVFSDIEEYRSVYRPLFEVILAAKQQLNEEEVCRILDIDPDELRFRLRKLRSYVYEMKQGNDMVLQVFHKSFLEWLVSDSAGIYRIHTSRGDRLYTGYMLRCAGRKEDFSPYFVRFALAHFEPKQWEDMEPAVKKQILNRLADGAGRYGMLDQERTYLGILENETGKDSGYYIHLLKYIRKTTGNALTDAAEEALEYVQNHEISEQESFDLICEVAYAYYYAGLEERSFQLITGERKKHGKAFWNTGINEANFWHITALTAHDLDNNDEVVRAAGNDVRHYKKERKYYDMFISLVNLFDGYMALGNPVKAEETAKRVLSLSEDRYYIHVDDILQICYANLLQTEGRIMEALVWYETGLKLAAQIHDWDYLYGSIWRELAIARFGDHSCFAALERYRRQAAKNSYRYLESLADCFRLLSAYILGDEEKMRDEAVFERLKGYAFPGHLLQAYCVRILGGAEKPDETYLLSLLYKCEGVKGEPTVVAEVSERFKDTMADDSKKQIRKWCDTYVSGIVSYREAFEKKLTEGLSGQPLLKRFPCAGCRAVCCYDGVYVTAAEEKQITEFVTQNPEHFTWLKQPYIVDGDWPGMRSRRKTEKAEYDGYDTSFPGHFTKTRCVFALPSGQCALQRAATDMQMHPWRIKPAACWSFPIRSIHDGCIDPPLTDRDEDPDNIGENYPGYVTFLPCVKHAEKTEASRSWTEKYRNEIEYIRYLEKEKQRLSNRT